LSHIRSITLSLWWYLICLDYLSVRADLCKDAVSHLLGKAASPGENMKPGEMDWLQSYTFCECCIKVTSSNTQGWIHSLHLPLGQLARKALNLLPKIDTTRYSVWTNQITAFISKLFSLVILLIRKWGWNKWNDSIRSAVIRRKFN